MAKKTNYFSHDSNSRNDEKLLAVRMRLGAEGYGIYFMLLERLREEADYMSVKDYNMIAFDLRVDSKAIKSVVEDFGLFVFTDDGKYFYSESFNRRMQIKDESARKRSEAGKKGMEKRWGKQCYNNVIKNDNNDITMLQKNITSKVKESKVNNTPLTPLSKKVGNEGNWRKDFEVYKEQLRVKYKEIRKDTEWIAQQQSFYPSVDILKSLEKACINYWSTEAGWMNKKSKRTKSINWKTTFANALAMPANKVYKNNQNAEKEPYDNVVDI